MTTVNPPARRRSWMPILVLLLIVIVGGAIGAYLDWRMWHPSSGIVVTIGAIGLLLIGVLASAAGPKPVRPVAYGVVALAIGAVLGQNAGPSRPPVDQLGGTITVELTEPADAKPITGRAQCQLTPDGSNFEVSGDPNLRLQTGDQPLEERDPIQVAVARGDMWEHGAGSRSDRWSMLVVVGDAGPFIGDEMPSEVTMATDASSDVTGSGEQRAGSLSFSGLVWKDMGLGTGDPMELSGTVSWTCDGPPADPEG